MLGTDHPTALECNFMGPWNAREFRGHPVHPPTTFPSRLAGTKSLLSQLKKSESSMCIHTTRFFFLYNPTLLGYPGGARERGEAGGKGLL